MGSGAAENLKIRGTGSASGGIYQLVKISGQGKISGDIECSSFSCMGESEVDGNVKAKELKVTGTSVFNGAVSTETAGITGQFDIFGDLAVKRLICTGHANVRGNVAGEEIRIRGDFQVSGNCESEKMYSTGMLDVGGLLNAGLIEIKLFGECRAKEIGGETVIVRRPGWLGLFSRWFGPPALSSLTADIIEGDNLRLELTKAKIVRGNRVILGPGCEIGLVEYKDKLYTDKSAKVKEQIKI